MPGLTKPTGAAEAPLRSWVARQHDAGAKILGVCTGSLVLAPTGMLDGLNATSHWSRMSAGLVLLTASFAKAPGLSRVVVPSADTPDAVDPRLRAWADQQRLSVEPLTGLPGPDGSVGGAGSTPPCKTLPIRPTLPPPPRPPR